MFTCCCRCCIVSTVAVVGYGLGLILVVCFCVVYVMHACVQFRILLVLLSRVLLAGGFDCECVCFVWCRLMRWFGGLGCLRVFGC